MPLQPCQSLLIDPFARRKVRYATDDLKAVVDRAHSRASAPAGIDPWLKAAAMDPIKRLGTYPRQQALETAYVVVDAPLVLVLQHKLRRGLLEGSSRPDAVDLELVGSLPSLSRGTRSASSS